MNNWTEIIKPLFDERGMKPKDIANALGCTIRHVYHWNNEESFTFTQYYYELSQFLNVSVEYLKGETKNKIPQSSNADKYSALLMELCEDNLEKLRQVQDALSKEPEKTKAKFDLFLKTL